MVEIYDFRDQAQKAMVFLVKVAKRAYEAKRRATMKKLSVKLAQEAERDQHRATNKLLYVKLGPWPIKKYWIPCFQLGPKQSCR